MEGETDPGTVHSASDPSDARCLELLRRWLSGEDGALDEWLEECPRSVDVRSLLLEKDGQLARKARELSAKYHEIVALRRRVEPLEREVPVPLP